MVGFKRVKMLMGISRKIFCPELLNFPAVVDQKRRKLNLNPFATHHDIRVNSKFKKEILFVTHIIISYVSETSDVDS